MPTTQARIDSAARRAHNGVDSGRKLAKRAAHEVEEASDELSSKVSGAFSRAEDIVQSGMGWMRDSRDRVRGEVSRASDRTVDYIREQPVRSVVAAAATGAVVYAIFSALRGRRSSED